MKKIKIGEYIRTKNGIIGKVIALLGKDCCYKNMNTYEIDTIFGDVYEEDIEKHSNNIIDLIEIRRLCK